MTSLREALEAAGVPSAGAIEVAADHLDGGVSDFREGLPKAYAIDGTAIARVVVERRLAELELLRDTSGRVGIPVRASVFNDQGTMWITPEDVLAALFPEVR